MLSRSSLSTTVIVVVIIGVAAFFGAKALTASLADNGPGKHSRPRIIGVAATPVPPPPEWPQKKRNNPTGERPGGETNGGSTNLDGTEYEAPLEGGSSEALPEPTEDPPAPDPEPPKEQSGGSGGGFVEEGSVGG